MFRTDVKTFSNKNFGTLDIKCSMKSIVHFVQDPTLPLIETFDNEDPDAGSGSEVAGAGDGVASYRFAGDATKWSFRDTGDNWLRQFDMEADAYGGGVASNNLWANVLLQAPSFESNDKGTMFRAEGRHYFQDVENAGLLRVGSSSGIPGIHAENNKDLLLSVGRDRTAHLGAYGQGRHLSVNSDGSLRVRGRGHFESLAFRNGWQIFPKKHDLCFMNPYGVQWCLAERLPPIPNPWLVKPVDEQYNLARREP